jgi:hypothetical protein
MRPPRTRLTPAAMAVAVGIGVLASATMVYAVGLQSDGTHLRAQWTTGGDAWLELEDRNVEPTICFIWDNDVPQDGDSIASRILTRTGTVVVDLGTGDQWVDGSGSGCEIPRGDRYLDVFTNPGNYVVEFEVVENQGTARTGPLRSRPLAPASS